MEFIGLQKRNAQDISFHLFLFSDDVFLLIITQSPPPLKHYNKQQK